MNVFKSRKAQQGPATPTFSMLPIVFALVFLAIVGSTTVFFVGTFMKTKTDVSSTYAALTATEVLTAYGGITYFDVPTQRNFITTVDLARFEDSILDNSMNIPNNRKFAAKLTITKTNGDVVKEAFLNKAEFVETGNNLVEVRRITIRHGENEYPGMIEINVRMKG